MGGSEMKYITTFDTRLEGLTDGELYISPISINTGILEQDNAYVKLYRKFIKERKKVYIRTGWRHKVTKGVLSIDEAVNFKELTRWTTGVPKLLYNVNVLRLARSAVTVEIIKPNKETYTPTFNPYDKRDFAEAISRRRVMKSREDQSQYEKATINLLQKITWYAPSEDYDILLADLHKSGIVHSTAPLSYSPKYRFLAGGTAFLKVLNIDTLEELSKKHTKYIDYDGVSKDPYNIVDIAKPNALYAVCKLQLKSWTDEVLQARIDKNK